MSDKYPYNVIDKVASDIIKQHNLTVPLDMGELFKKYEDTISIYASDSPELKKDNVLGVVSKLPPKKYKIFFLKDQPTVRMRFTLAHELGHIKLGHMEGIDVMVDRLFRDEFGANNSDKEKEQEANDFAGCLLMPKEEVIKKRNELKDIRAIADYFKVSDQVASIRVFRLNLIKY